MNIMSSSLSVRWLYWVFLMAYLNSFMSSPPRPSSSASSNVSFSFYRIYININSLNVLIIHLPVFGQRHLPPFKKFSSNDYNINLLNYLRQQIILYCSSAFTNLKDFFHLVFLCHRSVFIGISTSLGMKNAFCGYIQFVP